MASELLREALAYLEAHHVMTLATAGADGPWAAAVFYVNKGFHLYFFTEEKTRHGSHLLMNPVVAATIQEDYRDWREIKGIQLRGEATPVGTLEKTRVTALFVRKFPSMSIFLAGPKTAAALARAEVYKLVPNEIWYLDNRKGFSTRQKISLNDAN